MKINTMQLALYAALSLFPAIGSAYSIDPAAADFDALLDTGLTLSGDSEIHYNRMFIDSGATVTVTAPAGSQVHFIANGDILINGMLDWLDGSLSLTSIGGSIRIMGILHAESINLSAGTVTIQDMADLVVSGPGNLVVLTSPGDLQLQPVPIPAALWLLLSGIGAIAAFGRTRPGRGHRIGRAA